MHGQGHILASTMSTLRRSTAPQVPTTAPPKPRDDEIDAFGLTHAGKVRRDNQDHYLLCTLHKTIRVHSTSLPKPDFVDRPSERLAMVAMVADGVGGAAGGETASRSAVVTVAAYLTHVMECYYRVDPRDEQAFFNALLDAAREAHQAVLTRAKADAGLEGMATTLTIGLGVWPSLYVLHVGDSRLYLLRDQVLTQLTRDQTWAQDLVDEGVLPPAVAPTSPLSHVLTSAIGGASAPQVTRFELQRGDTALFCTDGLTKHVPDARIRECLTTMSSAQGACAVLLEDALAGGGSDNITIVVIRNRGLA